MTYALLASTFGRVADAGGASTLIGQVLFGLGAAILLAAVCLLARAPETPARYAGSRRR